MGPFKLEVPRKEIVSASAGWAVGLRRGLRTIGSTTCPTPAGTATCIWAPLGLVICSICPGATPAGQVTDIICGAATGTRRHMHRDNTVLRL